MASVLNNFIVLTVSDEVANKALEELGIHIDLLQCEPSPLGGKRWLCSIKGCSKHFPKLSSLKVFYTLNYCTIEDYLNFCSLYCILKSYSSMLKFNFSSFIIVAKVLIMAFKLLFQFCNIILFFILQICHLLFIL